MARFYCDIDQYQDHTAIITQKGEKVTYSQLIQEGNKFVEIIEPRNLVFLICNNSLEAICAYIACLRNKIVPILVNSGTSEELIINLLHMYKPSYIFTPTNKIKSIEEYKIVKNYREYTLLQTGFIIDYHLNDDLALLLTTSGSTGSPKLVMQSYKNINSNAISIAKYLNITVDDRAITTMPMSYTYGLSIINSHLLQGACIIANDYTLMDKEFWKLLKDENATTFGGVPYIYEMLKKLRFERMNLPSLKYITQAGGKLSKEMAAEFIGICEEKNIKLIIMYGQTEATARMSYLPWHIAKEKSASIGVAIPGGEFLIIDTEEKVIEGTEITGELVYKGDNVTLGYSENCYDLNRNDENKGILHTGDMAKRDTDGYYYIVGRKKRFLKIYGNRINLDEVEGVLNSKGYQCACSGVDDKLRIYTTIENIQHEIVSFVSKLTGINPIGFEVKYIETIPRNDAGKVLYTSLK